MLTPSLNKAKQSLQQHHNKYCDATCVSWLWALRLRVGGLLLDSWLWTLFLYWLLTDYFPCFYLCSFWVMCFLFFWIYFFCFIPCMSNFISCLCPVSRPCDHLHLFLVCFTCVHSTLPSSCTYVSVLPSVFVSLSLFIRHFFLYTFLLSFSLLCLGPPTQCTLTLCCK